MSLERPDVTSSTEDLIDEGGESSVLDGETVDKETNTGLIFSSVVESFQFRTATIRARQSKKVQCILVSYPYYLWVCS